MSRDLIPEDVRRFVLTSIPSIPFVEAILLFRRHAPQGLTAPQVAVALYVSERAALELLQSLLAAGVLGQGGVAFFYAPRDDAMALALDRLVKAYADDLIGVTNLIHDATHKSARRFADAFKLRRDR